VERIAAFLDVLPPQMRDPVLFAIPFFLALLILEWTAARKLEHLESQDRPAAGAFHTRDSWASIKMGLVSVATTAAWKFIALLGYAAIFAYLAPWHLSARQWYTWVIAILGVDVLFYTYHRIAHRVRLIWATHQAHHSSEYFNFATALRQKWNNSGEVLMWIPLPLLGIPPWMVFASFSVNLIYQFWVHTERIDKMWRPFEFIFNTPSHHRVHHGMDPQYLDKNYAGIFIVWDRMFGSFQPETARPHYGLTKPVNTFNIWKLQTREYVAIARDVRSAGSWRNRLGYVFGPPGWEPAMPPSRDFGALTNAQRSVVSRDIADTYGAGLVSRLR
jgi:sterol desaturase/sphingolipid hydroxylase (fatty acid hydroxylase superfamily)